MNSLSPKEIEERLQRPPASPPPHLLEALKAEIPEPAGETPAPQERSWQPRRWAIAASVVIAVGGGVLGYRTMRELPIEDAFEQSEVEAIEPRADLEATPDADLVSETESEVALQQSAAELEKRHERFTPPVEPQEEEAESSQPDDRIMAALHDLPKPPPPPVPEPSRAERDDSLDTAAAAATYPKAVRKLGPPEAEEVVTVTSESPLLDQRVTAEGHLRQEPRQEAAAAPPARARVRRDEIPTARDPWSARVAEVPKPAPAPMPEPMAPPMMAPPPSTGGTAEPNDRPYGDVFYRDYGVNPFVDTEDDRLSTFGLDVDTGSYAIARRYLSDGHLPPREAIRVEEFLNYFDYRDDAPKRGDFALHAELAPTPFGSGERYHVLRFGIRGREISAESRKPATLIFVVDVSGSMGRENRLGLVRRSLTRLLDQLRSDDRVGLVVYGSRAQVLLEPTSDLEAIRNSIYRLQPSGSTNAEQGLLMGYRLAGRYFREDAINRIILCSDGVANVGNTGPETILRFITQEARRGIELTTVGFGMGNYNDVLMEQLANQGDGQYAYVDDLAEADRIFVENLTGTLQTIAADAKVQVEFNPKVVSRYRLLGYENRAVADERFRDDTVDAGEIGAGHSVTALYEVKLHRERPRSQALATLHLRYRSKRSGEIEERKLAVRERDGAKRWSDAPASLQLAAAVAEFAEVLKGSYWAEGGDYDRLLTIAQEASAGLAGDADVAELVGLIAKAAKATRAERPAD